jgi:hypothetical protein
MKYILVAFFTLIVLVALVTLFVASVYHLYSKCSYKNAEWKIKTKDLPEGKMGLWIERGPNKDLWTEVDSNDDAVMYEYDRLLDACNVRNATRKVLHL